MATVDDVKLLFSEFPKEAISWRAQTMTKNGDKAMALAYIDARDVMDRLDSIVGSENWQDRYEFAGPRTICYLSINVDGQWITKADGAGDTDVEAEKGAISDAFKRAAVKWGIGRYLYSLSTPWVPCESYESGGKLRWRKWTDDPWNHIRMPNAPKASAAQMKRGLEAIENELIDCHSIPAVNTLAKSWAAQMDREGWTKDYRDIAAPKFGARRDALQKEAA